MIAWDFLQLTLTSVILLILDGVSIFFSSHSFVHQVDNLRRIYMLLIYPTAVKINTLACTTNVWNILGLWHILVYYIQIWYVIEGNNISLDSYVFSFLNMVQMKDVILKICQSIFSPATKDRNLMNKDRIYFIPQTHFNGQKLKFWS